VKPLIVGTRGSKLAILQAMEVEKQLKLSGIRCEIKTLSSLGDRSLGGDLSSKVGQFVHGIDEALIEGAVDITVHSAKDIPIEGMNGVNTLAYMERDVTSDLILANGIEEWPSLSEVLESSRSKSLISIMKSVPMKSKIGTVAGRRQSFLLSSRPDIIPISVRGHIETRMNRLIENLVDYLILAEVGIRRLYNAGHITEEALEIKALRIKEKDWPTAPGQGAIAVNCRVQDEEKFCELRTILNHIPTELDVSKERSLLGLIGGGCLFPAGIKSEGGVITAAISPKDWRTRYSRGDTYKIHRYIGDTEGFNFTSNEAEEKHLQSFPKDSPKLVTTLTSDRLTSQLRKEGVPTLNVPVVKLRPLIDNWPVRFLEQFGVRSRWPILVLTSPFAAKCAVEVSKINPEIGQIGWLALGEGTHKACFEEGVTVSHCGMVGNSEQLLEYIVSNVKRETSLYVPRSSKSDYRFIESLVEKGFGVEHWIAYENMSITPDNCSLSEEDVLLISSSSSAESWSSNRLKVPKTVLSMGKSTTETVETIPYFVGCEIITLEGPTVDYITSFWKSKVEGREIED